MECRGRGGTEWREANIEKKEKALQVWERQICKGNERKQKRNAESDVESKRLRGARKGKAEEKIKAKMNKRRKDVLRKNIRSRKQKEDEK